MRRLRPERTIILILALASIVLFIVSSLLRAKGADARYGRSSVSSPHLSHSSFFSCSSCSGFYYLSEWERVH